MLSSRGVDIDAEIGFNPEGNSSIIIREEYSEGIQGDDRITASRETALQVGTPGLGFAAKNTAHLARSVRGRGTIAPRL